MQRDEMDGNFHRFNVNFSPSAYQILQELADKSGTSMSEVLRQAIALKKWWEEVHKEGSRILIERDGDIREVVKVG